MTVTASDGNGNKTSDTVVITVAKAVTVSPTTLEVEKGASNTYTIKLNSAPSDDVTVTVTGTTSDITVETSTLTFTTTNYNTAQTITVNAATTTATNTTATLTHTATGGGYTGVTIDPVTVTITIRKPVFDLSFSGKSEVTDGEPIKLTITSDVALTGKVTVSLTIAPGSPHGIDGRDIEGGIGLRNASFNFGDRPSRTGRLNINTIPRSGIQILNANLIESFIVTLNQGAGYTVGSGRTVTGSVKPPETPSSPSGPQ